MSREDGWSSLPAEQFFDTRNSSPKEERQPMQTTELTQATEAATAASTNFAESASTAETPQTPKTPEIEAARLRANKFVAESNFTQARIALDEAEALEGGPKPAVAAASREHFRRFVSGVDSRIREKTKTAATAEGAQANIDNVEGAAVEREAVAGAPVTLDSTAVEEALKTVDRYSKIAAGVGLLPTFVLNFAAVLAVQITMVSKIAKIFHVSNDKERIRRSILTLLGSVLTSSVGHGVGLAVASIPAALAGTVLSFVLAPALAYSLTSALGRVFVMHFQSGGTLLTFDPRLVRAHFIKAFKDAGKDAGGEHEPAASPAAKAAAAAA
jgi:uncharacterized protein (DUF697 family)